MTIHQAINEMRKLTKEGKNFSFSFLSYNRTRQTSDGIIEVRKARLRVRESKKYNEMAELQEAYINVETGEPRRFWHCCLISFNGKSLTII
ncbi:hypothetical protein J5U18_12735 [Sphingobacteriaceae bacterium WQ 2009]|uniref:Uncharacterized protein n=1 Tax=Rhinopithecimicrobium faecis TaxID=2820698 RepID=A0A8T4HGG2_9SPHI|nr:hypothetical protein [Sphingobacteriaceae bacterium WQ 2009]